MVEDAIGRRIEVTVWRNGALVDVLVFPRELVTSVARSPSSGRARGQDGRMWA